MSANLQRDWLERQQDPRMRYVDLECDVLPGYKSIRYGGETLCVGYRWFSDQTSENVRDARKPNASRRMMVVPTFYAWNTKSGVPVWRGKPGFIPDCMLGTLAASVPDDWYEVIPADLRRIPTFSLQDGLRHYDAITEATVDLLSRTHNALKPSRQKHWAQLAQKQALEVNLGTPAEKQSDELWCSLQNSLLQRLKDPWYSYLDTFERLCLTPYVKVLRKQACDEVTAASNTLKFGTETLVLPQPQRALLWALTATAVVDAVHGERRYGAYQQGIGGREPDEVDSAQNHVNKAFANFDEPNFGDQVSDVEKQMPWVDLMAHYTARQAREGLWPAPKGLFTNDELCLPTGEPRSITLGAGVKASVRSLRQSMRTNFFKPVIPLKSAELQGQADQLIGSSHPNVTGNQQSVDAREGQKVLSPDQQTNAFINATINAQRELEMVLSACQQLLMEQVKTALGGELTEEERHSFAGTQVALDTACWFEHHALTALRLRVCRMDKDEVEEEAHRRALAEQQLMIDYLGRSTGSGNFAEWIQERKHDRSEKAERARQELLADLGARPAKSRRQKGRGRARQGASDQSTTSLAAPLADEDLLTQGDVTEDDIPSLLRLASPRQSAAPMTILHGNVATADTKNSRSAIAESMRQWPPWVLRDGLPHGDYRHTYHLPWTRPGQEFKRDPPQQPGDRTHSRLAGWWHNVPATDAPGPTRDPRLDADTKVKVTTYGVPEGSLQDVARDISRPEGELVSRETASKLWERFRGGESTSITLGEERTSGPEEEQSRG